MADFAFDLPNKDPTPERRGNPFHEECLKFLRALGTKDNGQLTRSELMRILRCKKVDIEQLAETLITQGGITPVIIPSKARPAQGFQLSMIHPPAGWKRRKLHRSM
jgi:hypothetical protein